MLDFLFDKFLNSFAGQSIISLLIIAGLNHLAKKTSNKKIEKYVSNIAKGIWFPIINVGGRIMEELGNTITGFGLLKCGQKAWKKIIEYFKDSAIVVYNAFMKPYREHPIFVVEDENGNEKQIPKNLIEYLFIRFEKGLNRVWSKKLKEELENEKHK